jgi:hypothetical protein
MTNLLALIRAVAVVLRLRAPVNRPAPVAVARERERLDRLRNPEKYRGNDSLNG